MQVTKHGNEGDREGIYIRGDFIRKKAKKHESKGSMKITFNSSCLAQLEHLFHGIYEAGRPKPNDYYLRGDLVRVFNLMAKEVYGSCNEFPVVEAFGSFLMDMFSVKSDLDLSVNFSNESVELPRDEKIKALRKFAKKLYRLQSRGHVSGVNPIISAKVPILKVIDCGTGIECDISIENKDGVLKSQLVFIISEIDERFQKLSSLMKAWATAYNINSSKDQTLNSLSIILLVAFHLQTREPPILPPFSALLKDGTNPETVRKVVQENLQYGKDNKESIAELFATLLSKLASVETLWPEGLCASPYEGSWISKTWDFKVGHISVEDFTDRSQNVARAVGTAGVKTIYKCVHSSLHHLSVFMDGKIEAPKLKALLFGAEPISHIEKKAKVNRKRSFPFHESAAATPLDPVATKKTRVKDGWSSWGEVDQAYGAIQNCLPSLIPPIPPEKPPFVIPGFDCAWQQGSTGFKDVCGPVLHPCPVPQYSGFDGAHGPVFPAAIGDTQWNSWPM
ncbi:hypothetical protein IFM89_004482 [Coptis chinensis]|uniref:Poly(A) RNA polymerase mitochondrial-like central palm domain-containing protein n=1 Tax=Coptis chinensis TaxID=261450 RepID=A0A835LAX1_9MAGN|nr:hypothetical protein IFM89_004482 [Coptis chinensis]